MTTQMTRSGKTIATIGANVAGALKLMWVAFARGFPLMFVD
ncbi:MAG: hypothetical protein JWR77_180, partial [Rhizorhabdus sp.]|nr:hypothetical protein [Rhizorhabdus sp.]